MVDSKFICMASTIVDNCDPPAEMALAASVKVQRQLYDGEHGVTYVFEDDSMLFISAQSEKKIVISGK
jgi:hypothetical protein